MKVVAPGNAIMTEIEKSSGFKIEQYTNFNIQMIFSSDSYLLLLRQDKDLCPIKICNELKNTVLLISQDPNKLTKGVAELSVAFGEEKEFSWAAPFSLDKKIFAIVYQQDVKKFSQIFQIDGDQARHNYDIEFSSSPQT